MRSVGVPLLGLLLVAAYAASAAVLLWLAHRFVRPLRLPVAAFIAFCPLLLTGKALVTAGIYAPLDIAFIFEPYASYRVDLGVKPPQNPVLSDVPAQVMPWLKAVRESIKQGRLPLWQRSVLAGFPLMGVPEPLLSPGTWIGFLFPLPQAWTLDMALRFLLPLLAAYLFFRELGCGEWAAVLGGVAWAFADFLVFWIGHPVTPAAAPFPLLLLGLRRLARDPGRRAAGLTVAALVLILAGGHSETALHCVAAAGLYFLFELYYAGRGGRRKPLLLSLGAGAMALGLFAVVLLPFLEAWPQTVENVSRSIGYAHEKKSVDLGMALEQGVTFFVPYAFGVWGFAGIVPRFLQEPVGPYAGALLLPLAFLAARSSTREKWVFALYVILGLSLYTRLPGVTDAVTALPLFNIVLNQRLAFLAAFGMAALAALGTERLVRDAPVKTFAAAALCAAAVTGALFAWRRSELIALHMPAAYMWRRFLLQVVPLVAAALLMVLVRRRGIVAAGLVLALFVAQRRWEAVTVVPTLPARAFLPHLDFLERIPRGEPYRVAGVGNVLMPNTAGFYELEDVRGFEPMNLGAFVRTYGLWCVDQPVWSNRVDDPTKPFLSFLNVKWLVAPPGYAEPAGWKLVSEGRGGRLFVNGRVLPRAFAPGFFGYVREPQRQLEILTDVEDFGAYGIVDRPAGMREDSARWEKNGQASVRIASYHGSSLTLAIEAQEPAVVATSIPRWKGWRLSIDGRRSDLTGYNIGFLGFWVPAGRHTVELTYLPDGFVYGALISGASVLVCLVLVLRRNSSAPMGPAPEAPPRA